MKWYWWTLIGLVVVAIIIFAIYKYNSKNKVTSTDGTPCTMSESSRTVGDAVTLPYVVQGIIKDGVCVSV